MPRKKKDAGADEKAKKKHASDKKHSHIRNILKITGMELRDHAPYTVVGAFTGIMLLAAIVKFGLLHDLHDYDEAIFFILHPAHIFLSALVTTSLYMRYGSKKLWIAVVIGFTGSLGIATMSDSVIPYLSELVLRLPDAHAHIGFIEEPLLTIPPAILGIALGYLVNATKFPHLGHVLLSTWASLFHVIMALGDTVAWYKVAFIFIFLFLAVWLPCCVSDIIWPMVFSMITRILRKETIDPDHCYICVHGHSHDHK